MHLRIGEGVVEESNLIDLAVEEVVVVANVIPAPAKSDMSKTYSSWNQKQDENI